MFLLLLIVTFPRKTDASRYGSLSLWLRNYLKKFFNELLHSSLIFAIFVRNCTY